MELNFKYHGKMMEFPSLEMFLSLQSGSENIKQFISERSISYWNKLPRHVKGSESVNDFRINLEGYN